MLTVLFRDRANPNRDLAPAFAGRYAPGDSYGPVLSPAVAGYTPEYREARSGADGMPAHDLTVIVYYNAIRPEPGPVPEEPAQGEEPGNEPPEGPEGTATKDTIPPAGIITQLDDGSTGLTDVGEEEVPLARVYPAYWALLNLIMALLTLLLSILLVLVRLLGQKEEKEQRTTDGDGEQPDADGSEETSVRVWQVLLSLFVTALAALVFFLTEDLSNSMRLADRWTILMLVILAIQAAVYLLATRRRGKDSGTDAGPV